MVVRCGKWDDLVGRGLDAATRRGFLVFYHVGYVSTDLENKVNLVEWGGHLWIRDANPFPWLTVASAFVWAPWDAGGDGLLASRVRCVVAHPQF